MPDTLRTRSRRAVATVAVAARLGAFAGPVGAVVIKMWTLVSEGYPEFIAFAAEVESVEFTVPRLLGHEMVEVAYA